MVEFPLSGKQLQKCIKCTSITVLGLLDLVTVTVLLSTTCGLLLLLMYD